MAPRSLSFTLRSGCVCVAAMPKKGARKPATGGGKGYGPPGVEDPDSGAEDIDPLPAADKMKRGQNGQQV